MQKQWLEEDNEKISSCKDMRRSNTQKNFFFCILIKKKELNTLSGLQEWQNTILQKTFFQHKTITSLGLYVIIIIRIQLDVTFKAIKTTPFQSFLPHVA